MMLIPAALLSAAACVQERAAAFEIADAIEERYVIENVATRSAEIIRRDIAAGALDVNCGDGPEFAEHLTRYLRDITGDKHFFVDFPSGNDDGDDWIEEWRKGAAANAYGIARVERMSGNIGYLALSSFYEYEPAKEALKGAFTLLSTSDAMILDLRDNGGGSPETAWPIEWTFRDAGAAIARRIDCRVCEEQPLKEADFDWPRYGSEKPLVILINKRSFSAAEAVAYGLQAEGRATVIGDGSGGGAHMVGEGVRVSGGWVVGIPEARPLNSMSQSNWEGGGIVPDIAVPSEDALSEALEFLTNKAPNMR
ncbi:S41 family peptidase [uncultured Erythrobacter sp.]|uniref:S41 family peptidase n=1 Tax=uncultured Erythrobacter sp. TaxID=263913 RepID=UPI0026178C42|nr:S41 family peptidase [uncultured Erythrobacter sp.]